MAGFLDILSKHLEKNKIRSRKYPILKASMAAAAVVAMADEDLDQRETRAVKRLLKVLESLKLFREDDSLDLFNGYIDKLQKDRDAAMKDVQVLLEAVKEDPDEAAAVVMMCKAVSQADRVIDAAETESIGRICDLLGLDKAAVEAIIVPSSKWVDQ